LGHLWAVFAIDTGLHAGCFRLPSYCSQVTAVLMKTTCVETGHHVSHFFATQDRRTLVIPRCPARFGEIYSDTYALNCILSRVPGCCYLARQENPLPALAISQTPELSPPPRAQSSPSRSALVLLNVNRPALQTATIFRHLSRDPPSLVNTYPNPFYALPQL